MSQLEIYFTTPHEVDPGLVVTTPAKILARAWNFDDGNLDAPMGASPRQFDFSVSIYDPVHDEVKLTKADGITAYDTFVYVEWRGFPRFWGPIIDPEWDSESGKVTFRCYSQMKRYEAHFLRIGDLIWSGDADGISVGTGANANKYSSFVPIDYRTLRLIRDAVENTPTQNYAPLGIRDGANTASTSTELIELERGQNCLRALETVLASSFAPEMLEVPLRVNDDPPYYAELQTAPKLGIDRTDTVLFQGGFGLDNVQGVKFTPGGKLVTHAHVLDRDGTHRETRVNTTSARKYGVWVDWESMDFAVTDAQADPILGDGVGQTVIDHYGVPAKFADLTLKPDDEIMGSGQYFWEEHFFHGDFILCEAKIGHLNIPHDAYRIIGTGLKQVDQESGVQQVISIVPEVTGTYVNLDE